MKPAPNRDPLSLLSLLISDRTPSQESFVSSKALIWTADHYDSLVCGMETAIKEHHLEALDVLVRIFDRLESPSGTYPKRRNKNVPPRTEFPVDLLCLAMSEDTKAYEMMQILVAEFRHLTIFEPGVYYLLTDWALPQEHAQDEDFVDDDERDPWSGAFASWTLDTLGLPEDLAANGPKSEPWYLNFDLDPLEG
jgi:hypothetical protein